MRIKTGYMRRQFVILPAIGLVKGGREYRYSFSGLWGFWAISIGLGKPLW